MARAVTDPAPILEDVAVAGLLIPAPLATRIIAALRAVYPTLTEGKDDDGAVRAVLIYWITAALETYEGNLLYYGKFQGPSARLRIWYTQ